MGGSLNLSRNSWNASQAHYYIFALLYFGTTARYIQLLLCSGVGGFVATLPATSSHFAKMDSNLPEAPFWAWRVLKIYQQGEPFPQLVSGKQVAAEETYEAQLYAQGAGRKLRPLWDKTSAATYLRTPAEKKRWRLRCRGSQTRLVTKDKRRSELAPLTLSLIHI